MRKYKRQCQQARANLMKLIEADRRAAADQAGERSYDELLQLALG